MNKQRRKSLEKIHDKLQTLQGELEEIMDEEESYKDNLPEGMVNRIEQAENAISFMDDSLTHLIDAIDALEAIE